MKREEIKAIFPEASDEQLSKVLDINGADVEKVKEGDKQKPMRYNSGKESVP